MVAARFIGAKKVVSETGAGGGESFKWGNPLAEERLVGVVRLLVGEFSGWTWTIIVVAGGNYDRGRLVAGKIFTDITEVVGTATGGGKGRGVMKFFCPDGFAQKNSNMVFGDRFY